MNTKIVRTPGWVSYMREREGGRSERVNTKIVRTPGWVSYVRERERERSEIMNTKVEGTSEPMLRRDVGREAEIL